MNIQIIQSFKKQRFVYDIELLFLFISQSMDGYEICF